MRKVLAPLLIAGLAVGMLVPDVWAADIPTFDVGPTRTRVVNSTVLANSYIQATPFYVPIPGQESYSTPVVVGSDLYQYTFTSGGQGTLWVFPMSAPPSSCFSSGQSCSVAWTSSQTYTWNPGWSNNVNEAGGVCSPTIAQGYTAIAVGKNAYSWPMKRHSLRRRYRRLAPTAAATPKPGRVPMWWWAVGMAG